MYIYNHLNFKFEFCFKFLKLHRRDFHFARNSALNICLALFVWIVLGHTLCTVLSNNPTANQIVNSVTVTKPDFFVTADCVHRLGMENGNIRDIQITASSSRPGDLPEYGRLNNDKYWCAAKKSKKEYFQVDLGQVNWENKKKVVRSHVILNQTTQDVCIFKNKLPHGPY